MTDSEKKALQEAEAANQHAVDERHSNTNLLESDSIGLIPTANFLLRWFAPKNRNDRRRERKNGKYNN